MLDSHLRSSWKALCFQMPNLSACSGFFLSVIVDTLCGVPVPHLSYYFRYCKPAKEAQTSNYILGLPGAGGDRGQVLRTLGETILLKPTFCCGFGLSSVGVHQTVPLCLGDQGLPLPLLTQECRYSPKAWTFITGTISVEEWRLYNFLKMWNDGGNFVVLIWTNQTVQRVSKFRDEQRFNVIGFSPWIYFFF